MTRRHNYDPVADDGFTEGATKVLILGGDGKTMATGANPLAVTLDGGSVNPVSIDDTSTANITYIGEAPIGTATSDPAWKIKIWDETNPNDKHFEFADGDENYDNVWDNRTSLIYSR